MERVTGWMIGNAADVHDIHLPPEPFVGGINGDHASITADPQLRVDPKIAVTDVPMSMRQSFFNLASLDGR